jgi:broad-specificity NMP kinase
VKILDKNHTCIIAGLPGIGKTTLAHILCAEFIANDWEVIHVFNSLREGLRVLKADKNAKQVLYYDDFLGQNSVGDKLAKNEDTLLVNVIESFKNEKNRRLIMTTRDYILAQARQIHEALDRADIDAAKYVLSLDDYTKFDKARILANHLYFQNVPKGHIDAIVSTKAYETIVSHRNYNPRIIATVTDAKKLSLISSIDYPAHFLDMLDNPSEIWARIFHEKISEPSRNLLLVLASCGIEVGINELRQAFLSYQKYMAEIYRSTRTSQDFERSLRDLESNFVKITRFPSSSTVAFHNPSIADFIEVHLQNHVEQAVELMHSAVHFEQVIRIVRLVIPKYDTLARLPPEFPVTAITEAFSRTLIAPSISLSVLSWFRRKDVMITPMKMGERIKKGVDISQNIQSEIFIHLLQKLSNEFFSEMHFSIAKPSATEIVQLLNAIEVSSRYDASDIVIWKEAAILAIINEPEDMENAVVASTWVSANINLLRDEQRTLFISGIEIVVSECLTHLQDDGDIDVLNSAADDAKLIENLLGLDFSHEIGILEEIVSERRKEDDSQYNSVWESAFEKDKEIDESKEDIASIFDSLLDS